LYREVNDALNEVFLGGRFDSRPLYLVLDNQGRGDLADLLGHRGDEVEAYCCHVVGKKLDPAGDPYDELFAEMGAWALGGRKQLPPFTALLFALAHAAELMVSDGDFMASNYYQRLSSLVDVSPQRLSQHGKSTAPFWRLFSKWLADNDFHYGRPTARAVNANKYVGVAMSQAIVREEDRQRLHQMFEKYGFTGTDEITGVEVEQYVSSWVNTSRPTSQFKAAWKKAELRPRICEIVVDELDDWKASTASAGAEKSGHATRLSLVLAFRHDLLARSATLWLGREATLASVELRGAAGPLELGNSTFGGLATVEPRSAVDLDEALQEGLSLESTAGDRFWWSTRAAIPLSRSPEPRNPAASSHRSASTRWTSSRLPAGGLGGTGSRGPRPRSLLGLRTCATSSATA